MNNILIFTLSPFCTFDNMGITLHRLFESYDPDNLFQFYIGNLTPDIKHCRNCYQISDFDIISKLFRRASGKFIEFSQESLDINTIDDSLYSTLKKTGIVSSDFSVLFRNFLWKNTQIDTSFSMNVLRDFSPKLIFFVLNEHLFTYDLCNFFIEQLNVPVVLYAADDYYFKESTKGLGVYKKYNKKLKNEIEHLMKKTSGFISIGDKMTEVYESTFAVKGYTIRTPYSKICAANQKSIDKNNVNLVFIGNLEFSRHLSLIEISVFLEELKIEKNINASIEIYTTTQDIKIINQLKKKTNIKLHDPVGKEKVIKILRECDFALHVESFDDEEIKNTAFSISTKIPDMLANANNIIAYGPEKIASIEYLKSISSYISSSSKEEFKSNFCYLIENSNERFNVCKLTREYAKKNHEKIELNSIFGEILEKVGGEL